MTMTSGTMVTAVQKGERRCKPGPGFVSSFVDGAGSNRLQHGLHRDGPSLSPLEILSGALFHYARFGLAQI